MKTLLAVLLLAMSTVAVAEESYMVKYEKDSQVIVVYTGSTSDTSTWVKKVYTVKENKVVGTGKTVQEFFDSFK